jgi:hypothetical protein
MTTRARKDQVVDSGETTDSALSPVVSVEVAQVAPDWRELVPVLETAGALATAASKGGPALLDYAAQLSTIHTEQDRALLVGEGAKTRTAAYAVAALTAYRDAADKPLTRKAIAARIANADGTTVSESRISQLRLSARLAVVFGIEEGQLWRDLTSKWQNNETVKAEIDRLLPVVTQGTEADAAEARESLAATIAELKSKPTTTTPNTTDVVESAPADTAGASVGGSEADSGAAGVEATPQDGRGAGEVNGEARWETHRNNARRIAHMEAMAAAMSALESGADYARLMAVHAAVEALLDGTDKDVRAEGQKIYAADYAA